MRVITLEDHQAEYLRRLLSKRHESVEHDRGALTHSDSNERRNLVAEQVRIDNILEAIKNAEIPEGVR